ncbi:MAG: tetratricopeptide repeat protein, partial [Deltaproteobacteria bacterium]|nr:tetratricopeptide repeat protein [Deltaproteobacteria bacterium]
ALLRAAVDRQLADALVGHAGRLRREPGEPARRESLAALGRAVSMLTDGRLKGEDAAQVAVGAGSVLVEGRGRWEAYPASPADEKERELIARILPLLPREGAPGERREEGPYLDAALRMNAKDPAAGAAARRYLEKYPASALSAGIGVRLGHDALLAGDVAGATARYRAASDAGNPEASSVARYMLGWIRYQSGDSEGALRELSQPLSDPLFPCGDPSPFERSVLSLAVRAGRDAAPARLESYPPVKEGTCVGKVFLSALWEAEEKRGESARAAAVRDIASRRFPSDANAAALEMETVEALLRSGREEDAYARVLTLRGKYGPHSAWGRSQTNDVRDRTAKELAGMFKILGERKFDEGIRTGGRSALSLAAAMFGEYLLVTGEKPPVDTGEIRLKQAIAFLGSGSRKEGVRLLDELTEEDRKDVVGERAGILYTETMIAGYERKEESAEDAEDAAYFILEKHPSGKAVELALRAASSFLADREYGRARGTAEEVEASRFASPAQAREARLIQAEASVFEGDHAGARGKADLVLTVPKEGMDAASSARATDLFLLSSLKGVDGMIASGNPLGAAAALEGLAERFPDAPEKPMYLLRAMRLYKQGGDGEGAIRTGSRFLSGYPRREEVVEAAGVVGPLLEEKGEHVKAGDLYESVAGAFPKSDFAPKFLFHAARIAELHGPGGAASRRFASWRARYSAPGWMWAYATLSIGLDGWRGGERKKSIRLLEEGLRKVDAGVEKDAPAELAEAAAKARIAVGENWAEQFRNTRLVVPLEKSLAIKDRFFRNALAAFGKAGEDAPLEIALQADLLSGDLLMEYGKAILESQRPKGLKGADLEGYEEALKARARSFFERSVEWCSGALDRLEKAKGPSDLAVPIRKRLETAQGLLESTATKGEKAR